MTVIIAAATSAPVRRQGVSLRHIGDERRQPERGGIIALVQLVQDARGPQVRRHKLLHHAADLAAHSARLGAFPLAPLGTDPRAPPPELGRAALRAVRIAEYLCQRCRLRVRIDTLALGCGMSRVKLLNFVKAKY